MLLRLGTQATEVAPSTDRDHPPPLSAAEAASPAQNRSRIRPHAPPRPPPPHRGRDRRERATGTQSGEKSPLQHVPPPVRSRKRVDRFVRPPRCRPSRRARLSADSAEPLALQATCSQDRRPSWGLVRQRPTAQPPETGRSRGVGWHRDVDRDPLQRFPHQNGTASGFHLAAGGRRPLGSCRGLQGHRCHRHCSHGYSTVSPMFPQAADRWPSLHAPPGLGAIAPVFGGFLWVHASGLSPFARPSCPSPLLQRRVSF